MTSAFLALAVAAALAFGLAWVGIALARRTSFYDRPGGYKRHEQPTPYLGGAAVFGGFAVAALALGDATGRFAVLFAVAAGLVALGTLDDRRPVPPGWRVLGEVGAAIALDTTGHGWAVFPWDAANLLLTLAWVVGLVNAFNLMDNLDGATATVAAVAGLGIGTLALIDGDVMLGVFAYAISGASVGFLPHNLARPARMFLGDGGSMPLGFLIASSTIAAVGHSTMGGSAVFAGAMLVGLVILDTSLVVFSRRRARVSLVTAGRDHLTHRLLTRLGSARRVAAVLALGQGALCGLAILGDQLGALSLALCSAGSVTAGLVVIALLESRSWRPVREPEATRVELASDSPAPEPTYRAVVSGVDVR
jgi:UDP-GlcNAc:undecaprenyl-phosphate GlcNAc-1-phosphate transferase